MKRPVENLTLSNKKAEMKCKQSTDQGEEFINNMPVKYKNNYTIQP